MGTINLKGDAQKFFSTKAGKIVIWGGIALATLIIIRIGLAAYYRMKNPKNVTEPGELGEDLTQPKTNDSVLDLGSVTVRIYNAFYKCGWFSLGACEDEDTAIAALNTVPDEYIDKLASIYLKAYNHILKEDFMKYLSDDDWKRVQSKFS